MPFPAYLTITGTRQGLITADVLSEEAAGSLHQPAHKDQILVQGFEHRIHVPPGNNGKRVHLPLTITKAIDKSSPLLVNALATGESLKECLLEIFSIAETGGLELLYSIKFRDAIVQAIDLVMPHCNEVSTAHYTHLERVSFTYRRANWHHVPGNTFASDSWESSF